MGAGWQLPAAGQPHWQDYSCTAADRSAVLASAVPEPSGSAVLLQEIYAEDYRGRTVTFRGQLRTAGVAGQAGLHLAAGRAVDPPGAHLRDRGGSSLTGPGSSDWTWHEVTMPVPGDAGVIRFGISLAGRGRIELRNAGTVPGTAGNSGVRQSMDIPDGDLVRLARDGDPAAFRLLVERHLPMARARAARLCPQPDDADDAVQDAFLQAFIALDRLRDPGRFAGWLGGIVANVCRAQRRRAPLTLLGDWPENLHPASAHGLPSAEDLDRADALGRAVAGLPRAAPGRHLVLLRRPARRADRRHARRGQGQPAQGPPPAARVHHRAPPRPHPRHLPENPHDRRPHRARRPLARTPHQTASWCLPTTPGTGRCRSGCPPATARSGACSPAPATATRNTPTTMPGR